jgi:hypothetical protein
MQVRTLEAPDLDGLRSLSPDMKAVAILCREVRGAHLRHHQPRRFGVVLVTHAHVAHLRVCLHVCVPTLCL